MSRPHRVTTHMLLGGLLAATAGLALASGAQAGDRREDRYGASDRARYEQVRGEQDRDGRYRDSREQDWRRDDDGYGERRVERSVRGGERYSYERRESGYEAGIGGYVHEDADGRRGAIAGYEDGYEETYRDGYATRYGEEDGWYEEDLYDRRDRRDVGYGHEVVEGGRVTGYAFGYAERRYEEGYEDGYRERRNERYGRDCPERRYGADDDRRWKGCKGSGVVRLNDGFFWGSGGVGPEYIGGGEGGGGVVVIGGAGAGSGASAYASARASASVSIRIGGKGRPGKPGGGHPGKPCGGCGAGGGKGH